MKKKVIVGLISLLAILALLGFPYYLAKKNKYYQSDNRWVHIETFDGEEYYIDITSISPYEKDYVMAFVKAIRPDGSYSIETWAFDCKGKRISLLQEVEYNSKGKLIKSKTYVKSKSSVYWVFIVPDTVSEVLWKRVCEQ